MSDPRTTDKRPLPKNEFDSDQWVTLFLWDAARNPSLMTDRAELEAWFSHMLDCHADGCATVYGHTT